MNREKVVLIAAIAVCCAGTACYKIKSAGFIVRVNTATLPGISEGGKLRWVSLEAEKFVIHIDPVSPCTGGANDLASRSSRHGGKTTTEADCTVDKKMDGYYTYSILVPGSGLKRSAAMRSSDSTSPPVNIAFHVDYCPLCSAVKLKKMPPQQPPDGFQNGGPDILFGCDEGTLYTLDPNPSVYAGQVVLWSPLGPEKSTEWQADNFMPTLCAGDRQSFGTIVDGSPTACSVSDKEPGKVTYTLQYKSTTTPAQSCKGTASITVVPVPMR